MRLKILIILFCGMHHHFTASAQLYTPDGTIQSVTNGTTNIGIGLSAPSGILHVQGVGGNKWIYFSNNINGEIDPQNKPGLAFGWNRSGADGESLVIYNTSHGSSPKLSFNSFNGSSLVEEMILVNGKVGIGTNNPGSFKLAVDGKIGAREVNVTLASPWPDYVFESDYQLLSLEELQIYISQNKHLPDVPSAKTMEENGINLSEMNMILLKKVEELTLYVIEQHKTIDLQQKQINALQSDISELKKKNKK